MRRGLLVLLWNLLHVVFELLGAGGVAQLAERLRLYLAYALAGDAELTAHFFQRAAASVFEAVAQLQHAALALGERAEHGANLLLQQVVRGGVGRGYRLGVLDEV